MNMKYFFIITLFFNSSLLAIFGVGVVDGYFPAQTRDNVLLENANVGNVPDMSPFAVAIVNGDLGLAQLLIGKGVDINEKNTVSGNTPLHYAVNAGKVEMVKILIENGANFRLRNKYGFTPIGLVAEAIERGETNKRPIYDLLKNNLEESQKCYIKRCKESLHVEI